MTIGGVHFRTEDDADIQADMNMAEILSRVLPYSPKSSLHNIGSTNSPERKLNRKKHFDT